MTNQELKNINGGGCLPEEYIIICFPPIIVCDFPKPKLPPCFPEVPVFSA